MHCSIWYIAKTSMQSPHKLLHLWLTRCLFSPRGYNWVHLERLRRLIDTYVGRGRQPLGIWWQYPRSCLKINIISLLGHRYNIISFLSEHWKGRIVLCVCVRANWMICLQIDYPQSKMFLSLPYLHSVLNMYHFCQRSKRQVCKFLCNKR